MALTLAKVRNYTLRMVVVYAQVLRKYVVFAGRAPRYEFWWFILAQTVLGGLAAVLSGLIHDSIGLIWILYCFATLAPFMALSVRRLHDTGRSAWWLTGVLLAPIAIALVTIGVLLIVFSFFSIFVAGLLGGVFVLFSSVPAVLDPVSCFLGNASACHSEAAVTTGGDIVSDGVETAVGLAVLGFLMATVGGIMLFPAAIFFVILIVFFAQPGQTRENKYGPQPTREIGNIPSPS